MSIITDFLEKNVHRDTTISLKIKNIYKEDFVFKVHTGESDASGKPLPDEEITIPAGATVHLPKGIGMQAVFQLARKIEYAMCENKKQWKGSNLSNMIKIAERIVEETDKAEPKKKSSLALDTEEVTDISKLSYKELQIYYTEKTGKNSVGKKKVDLLKELSTN